ncbi:MAG: conjugal transfer protein TraF [Pseudohongiellaceae bacterium]
MTIHKTAFSTSLLAIACASPFAAASTPFNGQTTALSGAGIATSEYSEGLVLNPAAPGRFRAEQDFNLHLNLGLEAADQDDLLDSAETLSDTLDRIEGQVPDTQTVEDVIGQLQAISGKRANVRTGGGLYASIPTESVTISAFARTDMALGVVATTSDNDIALLRAAAEDGVPFDTANLDSSVLATGAALSEGGIGFARENGDLSYGATLKIQRVDVIEYRARIDNFDEDNFDASEYRTDDTAFNLDLGVQRRYGDWQFGAVLTDAFRKEHRSVSGREVVIEPRFAVGGGYRSGWFTAALDLDVNAAPNRVTGEDSQFARVGIELDAWDWAQLRFGYRSDIQSALADTVSAGIGLSPFGVMNMDLAVVAGENDTVGVTVQAGLSF